MEKIIVDDLTYFRALDHSVRDAMKIFETSLADVAEETVSDVGVEVGDYPVEGYYHETPQLTRYFNAVKTLQDPDNFSEKVTDNVRLFNKIYTHSVFGLKQAMPTALNKTDVQWKDHPPVVVSPVIDPVTIATQKTCPNWTLDTIMTAIEVQELGTCLVGLAVIVDQKNKVNGKYNPVATTWARETTVLSAAKFICTSARSEPEIDWQVSKEVEAYGKKVLAGYADLIENNSITRNVRRPYEVSPKTIRGLLFRADDPERCVHLSTNLDGSHYHWAVVEENGKYRAVDFNEARIITTKEYQQNPAKFLKTGNRV